MRGAPAPGGMTSDLVRDAARSGDPDRYLSALFAPAKSRPHLYALYAFNAEIASIARRVREPALGLIRLQWWRDTLDSAAAPTGNPIADALHAAVASAVLDVTKLHSLIDAYESDLTADATPDRDALANYLTRTEGAVFALAAVCLGARAPDVEAAANASGVAYGFAGQLGASEARTASAQDQTEIIGFARERLAEARALIAELPQSMYPAFLPLALVDPVLNRYARGVGDPALGPLGRLWSLTAAAVRGRV